MANDKFYDEKLWKAIEILGGVLPDEQPTYYRCDFELNKIPLIIQKDGKQYKISFLYPDRNNQANNYAAEQAWEKLTTSIGVGQNRTPEQIACSIKTRMDWDGYRHVVSLFKLAVANLNENIIKHNQTVEKIINALGPNARKPRGNGTCATCATTIDIYQNDKLYGEIQIQGNSVDFRIRGIDADKNFQLIENIARLIY